MTRKDCCLPPLLVGLLLGCAGFPGLSQAQILHTQTGEVIPGTEGITPGPGVDLSGWNTPGHTLGFADLSNNNLMTASIVNSDLANADFFNSNLIDADFTGSNLTNANFEISVLTGASFKDTVIKGVDFFFTNFTAEQLYSTASYIDGNLSNISVHLFNLVNANFAGFRSDIYASI